MLTQAYKFCIGVLIVLFVSLQTVAISHASQHGDMPHSHDGLVCDVEAIADNVEIIEPALIVDGPAVYVIAESFDAPIIEVSYQRPPGRAPPPRSPPALSV